MNGASAAWLLPVLAFLLQGCAAPPSAARPARAAVLSGRVTFRGAPVSGATVRIAGRYGDADAGRARTTACDREGAFGATVPPGNYFVDAEGAFEGKAVYAFSGQNPVRLERGTRWIGMKAVERAEPTVVPATPGRGAALEGEVVLGGAPVDDAYVYVYASPDSLFKGMGIAISPPTGPDGKFAVEGLTESSYFVVARRRGAGGMTGPLEKGDLYGFFPGNPVSVRDGAATRIRIEMVEKEKPLSYADVTSGSDIALKGRVVDGAGRPQPGVYAFVYEDRVFGHQRPYGHSGRTGPDGTFAIFLDKPGVYYLGARETFGNSPAPGERFGLYGGTPDHSIRVEEANAVEGLLIVVDTILAGEP